jgi:hypothetical protein
MKALVGSWDHRPYGLLAENTALRSRIGELESALQRALEENAILRAALDDAVAVDVELDAEVALTS